MKRATNKAEQRPTWTSLTITALHDSDDFLTRPQLMVLTGGSSNQMSAALSHLKKFRVVDCLESDGHLYWFLTGEDTRVQITEVRTPEEPGTRNRRSGYHVRKNPLRVVANGTPGGDKQ